MKKDRRKWNIERQLSYGMIRVHLNLKLKMKIGNSGSRKNNEIKKSRILKVMC